MLSPRGATGATGPAGGTGATGPAGPTGPAGIVGTGNSFAAYDTIPGTLTAAPGPSPTPLWWNPEGSIWDGPLANFFWSQGSFHGNPSPTNTIVLTVSVNATLFVPPVTVAQPSTYAVEIAVYNRSTTGVVTYAYTAACATVLAPPAGQVELNVPVAATLALNPRQGLVLKVRNNSNQDVLVEGATRVVTVALVASFPASG